MSGVRPRKRFGQNFLHDPAIIQRIIDCIDPRPDEFIVEIGPGLGALTQPLLRGAGRLTAIEIDRDLPEALQSACRGLGELTVINADALRADFTALSAGAPMRLVGNLPYNISSPLLFHLLGHARAIKDMHFMLQQEVVDRMVASPGSRDYGRLTVALAVRARAQRLFTVGPGAFTPPPKVWSAVVRLQPLEEVPEPRVLDQLDRLLIQAFSQRRKTLRNSLGKLVGLDDLATCGLDGQARPETLSPSAFLSLARLLATRTAD
jgi:16S rRNA (adenine1518-N6/adenine1519-N6)-dimethyltransferase